MTKRNLKNSRLYKEAAVLFRGLTDLMAHKQNGTFDWCCCCDHNPLCLHPDYFWEERIVAFMLNIWPTLLCSGHSMIGGRESRGEEERGERKRKTHGTLLRARTVVIFDKIMFVSSRCAAVSQTDAFIPQSCARSHGTYLVCSTRRYPSA